MKKQNALITMVGLGILMMTNAANAAKSGKSGSFIGVEGNYDSVTYTHYAVSSSGTINQNVLNTPISSSDYAYSGNLILGHRFYLNDYFGVGIKTWGGAASYNNTSKYEVGNGTSYVGDFIINSDSFMLGVGTQIYLDFWNFAKGSLGLTLGAGYELKQFYNITEQTVHKASNTDHSDTVEDYFDNSLVLDGALHLQLGNRNRFEVGYKVQNYNTDKYVMQVDTPGYGRTIGFNVKNSIFVNYTFSF